MNDFNVLTPFKISAQDNCLRQLGELLQISSVVVARFGLAGESDGSCSFPVKGGHATISRGLGNTFIYSYPKQMKPHIYATFPCKSTYPFHEHYDTNYPIVWFAPQPHEVWILHHHSISSLCFLGVSGEIPSELKQEIVELFQRHHVKELIVHDSVFEKERLVGMAKALNLKTEILRNNILAVHLEYMKRGGNGSMETEESFNEFLLRDEMQKPLSTLPAPPVNPLPELSDFKLKLWSGVLEQYKHGGSNWERIKSFGLKLGLNEERIKKEVAL
jgi:hypothetical protein